MSGIPRTGTNEPWFPLSSYNVEKRLILTAFPFGAEDKLWVASAFPF